MPIYHRLGKTPPKRHTIFEKPNGDLYYEQLFGTIGFDGMSSLLYHTHRPTMVRSIGEAVNLTPKIAVNKNMMARKLIGYNVPPKDDFLESRVPVLVNNDIWIGLAAPRKSLRSYFYKNADADELLFIHKGTGTLRTLLGNIKFKYGDYLIIPRGMIYQIDFDSEDNRILYAESFHPIYTPRRYRNHFGQLLEHSPFCERDYILPTDLTFETKAFVVCSFCPRLYDYHPKSIPAPYNHSNIDSDEMLYYVDGDFMSRNNIGPGYITLHPGGIPHGPHPGAYERSIGQTETEELAVMIDTFKPLQITEEALKLDDGKYYQSWLENAEH